jgi:copper chaperone
MATTVLSIPDISCAHCQATITNALTPLDGVQSVTVDIATKKATVQYDPSVVQVDQMKHVLDEEDYPVESVE